MQYRLRVSSQAERIKLCSESAPFERSLWEVYFDREQACAELEARLERGYPASIASTPSEQVDNQGLSQETGLPIEIKSPPWGISDYWENYVIDESPENWLSRMTSELQDAEQDLHSAAKALALNSLELNSDSWQQDQFVRADVKNFFRHIIGKKRNNKTFDYQFSDEELKVALSVGLNPSALK